MRNARTIALTSTILTAILAFSLPARAQEISPKARAKAEVETRDAKKHNKLKSEAIPAAGGAVAGGVVAGPAGAVAGAKVGHSAGTVFHGTKKHHEVKKQEQADSANNQASE